MKSPFSLRNHIVTMGASLCLMGTLAAQSAQAAIINISLNNTAQLPANTGFQLQYISDGIDSNNNSVSASNFSGLLGTGSPDTSFGNASGNLNGNPSNPTVSDAAGAQSNVFFQTFNATANTISFNINTSINSIGGGQPFDSFSFQLYQSDGSTAYITNAPDQQSLFTINFDSLNNPTINFGSDKSVNSGNFSTNDPSLAGGQITATVTTAAVPEPSTWAMMALGLGALGLIARRKRSEAQDSNDLVGIAV